MAGANLAEMKRYYAAFTEARKAQRGPCIFISHISIDKVVALAIANYITERGGIDIYLDVYDEQLQKAVAAQDPQAITQLLEEGLRSSTHVLALVSKDTVRSWWVPYELGYAKRSEKDLATLTLKGASDLPAYLEIGKVLRGTTSLNAYLDVITASMLYKTRVFESSRPQLIPASKPMHPLDTVLDWQG